MKRTTSPEEIDRTISQAFNTISADPAGALRIAGKALKQARTLKSPEQTAMALLACGEAYHCLAMAEKRAAVYREVEELQAHLEDRAVRATILNELSRYLNMCGELARAVEYQTVVLEIREPLGEPRTLANAHNMMAMIRAGLGEFEQTLVHHFRALDLYDESGNMHGAADTLYHIGVVYADLMDNETALTYFRRELELSGKIGYEGGEARALVGIGCCLIDEGNPAEAIPMFARALTHYRQLNHWPDYANILDCLGTAYAEIGDHVRSMSYHKQALNIMQEQEIRVRVPSILFSIGDLHRKSGDIRGALVNYTAALELSEQLGLRYEALLLHARLAAVSEMLGEYRDAVQHYRRHKTLQEDMLGGRQRRGIAAAELRHAMNGHGLNDTPVPNERKSSGVHNGSHSVMLNLDQRKKALTSVAAAVEPLRRQAGGDTREIADRIVSNVRSVLDMQEECRPFEDRFEREHDGFVRRLLGICPSLTRSEIRICVLIQSNLSTKQIAEALFASPLTVKTHRTHIRRKLKIEGEGSLSSYLMSI